MQGYFLVKVVGLEKSDYPLKEVGIQARCKQKGELLSDVQDGLEEIEMCPNELERMF